jgi:hypothetical protein
MRSRPAGESKQAISGGVAAVVVGNSEARLDGMERWRGVAGS